MTNPVLVLLLISPEFLRSQFCHNEVGASWALSLSIHPLLVPPIDYADVRGVLAGTQFAKLDEKECLNDLRDDLIKKLGLAPLKQVIGNENGTRSRQTELPAFSDGIFFSGKFVSRRHPGARPITSFRRFAGRAFRCGIPNFCRPQRAAII